MANRATLMFSSDGVYSIETAGAGSLAWNYCIPVLWFALFQREDLAFHRHTEGDAAWQMPYLVTTVEKARAGLEARKFRLNALLAQPQYNPYDLPAAPGLEGLQALGGFLEQAHGFVILDPWELVTLGLPNLDKILTESIASLDHGDLAPLIEFASTRVSAEDNFEAFCGYRWNC